MVKHEKLIDDIHDKVWAVVAEFLSADIARELSREGLALWGSGEFRRA
jgi:hypothetical protein